MTDTVGIDPAEVHERELVMSKAMRNMMPGLRHILEMKRRHASPTNPTGAMDPRTASDLRLVAEELKLIWENENGD